MGSPHLYLPVVDTARLNTLQVVLVPFTAQSHLTCAPAMGRDSPEGRL